MKNQTVLCLSTTDWDAPQFGTRQQIMLRLARRNRVLYVEVPRALHSIISDPIGTRRYLRRMGGVRSVADSLLAYAPPPVLPIYYNPAINVINQRLLLTYLRRLLTRLGWQPTILWTYWPHTAYQVSRYGERLAVYHCIDDFPAITYPLTPKGSIARMEAELCRRVDVVFVRTEALATDKERHNPNTYLLPGGVDTAHFDPARSGILLAPDDMAMLPRPRIGLVGTIDDRVDVQLLLRCAAELAEASIVLVGPVKGHRVNIAPLYAQANVHLLGPKPYGDVPRYVAALDVCLIPYRINAYTRGLSPIKLYEYLAMGKPVVSTNLPYVRREADHVAIAASEEAFIAAVRDALASSPVDEDRLRFRAIAGRQSWDRHVAEMETVLMNLLRKKGYR